MVLSRDLFVCVCNAVVLVMSNLMKKTPTFFGRWSATLTETMNGSFVHNFYKLCKNQTKNYEITPLK